MPTAPTPVTPYATPPSSADPANFDERADAKVADDVVKVGEYNALANNVYGNAVEAVNAATTATAKASAALVSEAAALASSQSAAAAMGAPAWVSGATYAVGDPRWSPIDGRVYRRRTAGAGTTDPSADPTNWLCIGPNGLQLVKEAGTSATITANTDTAFTNSSACAATVPALAVGESFVVRFDNGRLDNTIDLGARSVIGLNGQIRSGVITLNAQPIISLRWWGDYYRSN